MKKIILLLIVSLFTVEHSYSQQLLGPGGFTGNDQDEWPKVYWYRDLSNNWDEGLIKHSSAKGVFGRAGYGIHLHESRDWGFYSTGWNTLFSVEGGTGNAYLRGALGVGKTDPIGQLDLYGGNGSYSSPVLNLQSNSSSVAWSLIRLNGGTFDTTGDYMIGRGRSTFNSGRSLTFHIPSRSGLYSGTGTYPQIAFVSSGADILGTIQAETGNWYMKGNVGIGTDDPLSKLAVDGQIRATEVKVLADISVPDYVFEPDYELRTLQETKEHIARHRHLPEIPSAAEIGENGIDLGDMNMRLLKKIEELTLYQIQLMGEIEAMKKELQELKK